MTEPAIRECDVCGEERPTLLLSSRGGSYAACKKCNQRQPSENQKEWPEDCPLTDSGAYNPPDVNHCPSCGGDVESTDTPTQYRCVGSGETFYLEV